MNKPNITRQEALIHVPAGFPDKVFLIGFRGYYKRTMGNPLINDRNIYDDCICIVSPDTFEAFNANTDPSIFKKGVSVLKAGIHPYRKGNHGISKPGGGYPALRPATVGERLPVVRDGQGESYGVAINIHKGGINSTSSLGCQTLYPSQWSDFIYKVYEEMDRYKQKTIQYILVEL